MTTRYVVIVIRSESQREVLAVMHHTRAEAEAVAGAWVAWFKDQISAEVVEIQIPMPKPEETEIEI